MAIIYFSYRAEDNGMIVESLRVRLVQLGGHTIYPQVTRAAMTKHSMLAQAHVVIVAIGPRWSPVIDFYGRHMIEDQEDRVYKEIALALWLKKPIIPLLYAQAPMPASEEMPPLLRPLASIPPVEIRSLQDSNNELIGLHLRISKIFSLIS